MAAQPKFAKPPCVITFSSEKEFIRWLLEHKVPYWEWGEEDRSKAWTEILEGDAVYSIGKIYEIPIAVRCICVVVSRVMMRHPAYGWLVLVEYKLNRSTHNYDPRRQQDSSLSEKMLLDPKSGIPVETPVNTIIRCLEQETGMRIAAEELSGDAVRFLHGNLLTEFAPAGLSRHPRLEGFGIGAKNVEEDFSSSAKFPHLLTYRQVARYKVELDPRHYRPTGWQDPGTRYYSKWRSVHERWSLKPIPASAIKRKRAVA